MPKKFSELRNRMSPEAREKSRLYKKQMVEEMALHELRAAHKLTQMRMAELLEVNQSEVSKIEKRTDMYVSTLASYIEAMGGSLEIRAVFPDGDVRIRRFDEIATEG